ncbi:MAG: class I SAM-dependent methyltransferase [Pseudomonadota bacterium]
MDLIEKATVMHYHRHRIAECRYGSVESLGWRSVTSQLARYEVLAKVGDLNGVSILDIGCGYGDLKAFLDLHYSNFDYIGIDQMPEFITKARIRYDGDLRTVFYQTDFSTVELPQVDVVIASGALGYRCKNDRFYTDMICKLYNSARIALAFNMLDKSIFPQHDLLIGHDRDEILALCRALSPRVVCVNGYLEDDFTVFMYRNGANG